MAHVALAPLWPAAHPDHTIESGSPSGSLARAVNVVLQGTWQVLGEAVTVSPGGPFRRGSEACRVTIPPRWSSAVTDTLAALVIVYGGKQATCAASPSASTGPNPPAYP